MAGAGSRCRLGLDSDLSHLAQFQAFPYIYIIVIPVPGFRLHCRDGEPPQDQPVKDRADPRDQPDRNDEELLADRLDQEDVGAADSPERLGTESAAGPGPSPASKR